MEIKKLTSKEYIEWNNFCLNSDNAWFWHTTSWLEYILNFELKREATNFSFFVSEGKTIKAIVPLIREKNKFNEKDIWEFSYQNAAIPAPSFDIRLAGTERLSIEKMVFEEIDRLAKNNNIGRSRFWLSPLARGFMKVPLSRNFPMEYGYTDISLNSLLIDLRKDEKELWRELRRNHRRNIEEGKKFKIEIYTKENIRDDIFYSYKTTHCKAAGRQTRSDKTFEMMLEWIKKGQAFLATAESEGKLIGFEHYIIYKNNVYGASAANDPDFAHLPIRHILEWEAILWMKKQGFDFYEIGLQQYGPLPYDCPSDKQINISHFKRGYGGFVVPLFISEKFYDKDYEQVTWQARIKEFLKLTNKSN